MVVFLGIVYISPLTGFFRDWHLRFYYKHTIPKGIFLTMLSE